MHLDVEIRVIFHIDEACGVPWNGPLLTAGTTVAQAKIMCAALYHKCDDPAEAQQIATRLKFFRLGVQLKDPITIHSAGCVNGSHIVVHGLCSAPIRPLDDAEPSEAVHVSVPLGASIIEGTESGASLCAAIKSLCLEFTGNDQSRANELLCSIKCALADGAAAPQSVRKHLEKLQQELGAEEFAVVQSRRPVV